MFLTGGGGGGGGGGKRRSVFAERTINFPGFETFAGDSFPAPNIPAFLHNIEGLHCLLLPW